MVQYQVSKVGLPTVAPGPDSVFLSKEARRQALRRDDALKEQIRQRDGDKCRYCGIEVDWTNRYAPSGAVFDHLDPEGDNSPDNLALSCRSCNAGKGRRDVGVTAGVTSNAIVTPAHGVTGVTPDIYVATPVVRSVSSKKKKEQVLEQEQLDKAKALLKPEDYEFLSACPDPFRTQWLIDPEWWISLRDGYPKVSAQLQASRYMAWEGARRKRDHRAALRNWIAKADRWREGDDMRKAVRR